MSLNYYFFFLLGIYSFYFFRTRTVVMVDSENNVDFYEETLIGTNPKKDSWEKTHLSMKF